MEKVRIIIIGLVIGLAGTSGTGFAITARQLQEMLSQGEEVTTIDIRNRALYTEGHIPGAISLPASILSKKRLPSIGTVVVYGDGIRTDLTLEAVDALNAKDGIQAEMLEGGFSAWEAVNLSTTHQSGLGRERLRFLTYRELEKAATGNSDIVLVDLRSTPAPVQGKTASNGTPTSKATRELTDLSVKFSGLNTIRLARKSGSANKERDIAPVILAGRHSLYILIDDGDGEAEKVARRLKAAGVKRIATLIGGERILRTGGRSGLKRIER